MALALIAIDHYTPLLADWRPRMLSLAEPLHRITNTPIVVVGYIRDHFVSRSTLQSRNSELEQQNIVLRHKVQRMASLMAENARLRDLLNSSQVLDDSVLIAELIGESSDPQRLEVIVNRGIKDGVYVGQPVLDAYGLTGMVIETTDSSSRVLLVADSKNAVPVQINRNGIRMIAEGTGSYYEMRLRHVAPTTDIKEGDLLVSSGLDGRYPTGYPVAEVISIHRDPGEAFLVVIARPSAELNKSRQLLLVFKRKAGMG